MTDDLPLLETRRCTLPPNLLSSWEQRQGHREGGGEVRESVAADQRLGQDAYGLGSPAVLGPSFRELARPVELNIWGSSKACLLFYFSVSVSKYSNSFFKFYISVE